MRILPARDILAGPAHARVSDHRVELPVIAIGRAGIDRVRTAGRADAPFVLRLADGREILARAVIDASGTWRTPNPLGANGLPAHGEADVAWLVYHALPDAYWAQTANPTPGDTPSLSAPGTPPPTPCSPRAVGRDRARYPDHLGGARQIGRAGLRWRGRRSVAGRGALGSGLRALVATGRVTLVEGFGVHTVHRTGTGIELLSADGRTIGADRVVAATGFRPDHGIAAELRLDLAPIIGCTRTLADLIDPNVHSCGTVRPHGVDELTQPEPDYYAVGMKSYGRAPTFLMATGYEQVPLHRRRPCRRLGRRPRRAARPRGG